MSKPISFIACIAGIIVFLSVAQVVVSNSLSTTGVELAKIKLEYDAYNKQNSIIREQFLLASSYTHIASKASMLGFVEEKSRLFLFTPLPLAIRP